MEEILARFPQDALMESVLQFVFLTPITRALVSVKIKRIVTTENVAGQNVLKN